MEILQKNVWDTIQTAEKEDTTKLLYTVYKIKLE